jgi:hypothetical protein
MRKAIPMGPRGRARPYCGQRCGPHAIANLGLRVLAAMAGGIFLFAAVAAFPQMAAAALVTGFAASGAGHRLHPHRAATPGVSPDRGFAWLNAATGSDWRPDTPSAASPRTPSAHERRFWPPRCSPPGPARWANAG